MPLDQQSVLPTVRGVPWWGAVLVATALTAIGAIMDAKNHGNLGAVFNFCLLVGCCLAALAVRRRALFTAAAQPPLIAFCVGVLALYSLNAGSASGLKSLVLKVLLPIAANFPWMAITFVVTLVLVVLRWLLTRPEGWNAKLWGGKSNNRPPAKRRANKSTRAAGTRASGARTEGDKATRTRRTETATSSSSRAATARTGSSRAATSTSSSSRAARQKDADARSTTSKPRASASVVGAAATADDDSGRARPRRPRAGDAARKTTESSEAPRRRAGDASRPTARPVPVTSEETTRIPADQADRPRPRARSAAADLDRYESGAAAAYQSTRSRNRS
ncbi:MAG TPA: hypothetical protein DIW80_22880 [Gordonia polyisoprenivorans]|nr:hypothetical protein [Gordonia polyisoprenivorans]